MTTFKRYFFLAVAVVAAGIFSQTASAEIVIPCDFSRDLEDGIVGEDVRCLQKFLNANGFTIASDGVGSPGRETNQYKSLTKEAVKKWQAANGLPATGMFGPLSRAKWSEKKNNSGSSSSSGSSSGSGSSNPGSNSNNGNSLALGQLLQGSTAALLDAYKAVKDAKSSLDSAWDEVKDAEDDGDDVEDAEDALTDAESALEDAQNMFFEGDFAEAKTLAQEAHDDIRDALGEIDRRGGKGLTFAEAIRYRNETVIKVEYKGEKYVIVTDENTKNDIIDEILDEVDDDDLEEEDVEDELVIEDKTRDSKASDKEFTADEDEADEALSEAEEAIDDAWDEVEEADNDGEDTDEAEDILDEAEHLLEEAEEAYDEEDYDEVIELSEEIKDLAEEAIDSL